MILNNFTTFTLGNPILRAIREQGYEHPTTIQQEAIPLVLAGKDLFGIAQTGTGKTAAFALPMLQMLTRKQRRQRQDIRALILTPTRELALQIHDSFTAYGKYLPLKTTVVLGGMSMSAQLRSLRQQPDFLVATPGRLLDLMRQGHIHFQDIEFFVLDEADRMLDMGFIDDVRTLVRRLPSQRQTMLFSATISPEIARLAAFMLNQPVRIDVTPPEPVSDHITQKVLFVDHMQKDALLTSLLQQASVHRALVFARTKRRADDIARRLQHQGIAADSIHSDKSQRERLRALASFERGSIKVLVGTDVVARGIDVDGISHVVNYELPDNPEWYVHRIGRTARAGALGTALSFCDADDVVKLKSIEKFTKNQLTPYDDQPFHSSFVASLHDEPKPSSSGSLRSFGRRSFGSRNPLRRRRGTFR